MLDCTLAGQMSWTEDNLCRWIVCDGDQPARRGDMRWTERIPEHHTLHSYLFDVLSGDLRLIFLVLRGSGGNRHGELSGKYCALGLCPHHVDLLQPILKRPWPRGDFLHLFRVLLRGSLPLHLLHEGSHGPFEGRAIEAVQRWLF